MTALIQNTTVYDLKSAYETRTNESKYPPGYLKNIYQIYEQHHVALMELAQTKHSEDSIDTDSLDRMEHRLLKNQAQMLKLGSSLQASNLEEIQDILKLWHLVAIQEVSPYDVSMADDLILVVYNYFASRETERRKPNSALA